MYGDKPTLSVREWLKQAFCWHRPDCTEYYDYTCPKCGLVSDKPLDGFNPRHLFWFLTNRLPKDSNA